MINTYRLKLIFKVFLFILLFSSYTRAEERPNIVWITSEDNSPGWFQLYDDNGVPAPNIEKLASAGVVFNNAFSNAPVCSAARSTLITGCYGPRIGTHYHRRSKLVPTPDGVKMYPVYLQNAGYYTANNSKEDYNVKGKKGWSASSKKASYRNRKEGQPFFQIWNIGTTHEGQLHFNPNNLDPKKLKTDPSKVEIFPYHPNTELFRYTYAFYYDRHRVVDNQVGAYIKQLEEDGLMENTIIFYYGDHGGVLPRSKGYIYESGLQVPLVVYVPEKYKYLVPVDRGGRVDGFVSFIDFAPTVLNLAGVKIPEQMDGKPFLGKDVTIKELNSRDETFSHADRFDEKYDLVRSYRKGRFKYMRSYQPFNMDGLFNEYRYKQAAFREWEELFKAGKLNAVQSRFFEARPAESLYDIENDPHETVNLATDPKYAQELKLLRNLLTKQVKSMPDLSFFPESYLYNNAFDNPVRFGQEHKAEIAKLIDIADLSLTGFKTAKEKIGKALTSYDSWQRYWGLIVCSSYGNEAISFAKEIEEIAENDKELLVRVRAAEFLSLTDAKNPVATLQKAVAESKDQTEVLLVLNTVALLKTVHPELKFDIDIKQFPVEWTEGKGNWITGRVNFIMQ
jgi:arylsulfatase A-like enzyme